jgi:Domain of unknown function (DUF4394)
MPTRSAARRAGCVRSIGRGQSFWPAPTLSNFVGMNNRKTVLSGRGLVWMAPLVALAGCQVLFGAELPEEDAAGAGAAGATAGGGTGGVGGSSSRAGVSGAGGTGGVSGVSGVGGTGGVGGTSDTAPCKTCSEVGSGEKASEVCRNNGAPTSLELFNAAFLCTCDKCPASCADACDSKQLLATSACATCQQTACAGPIDACLTDTPASREEPRYDVLALGDGNKLYSFKSNNTANVKTITVAGVKANTTLEGVDVRSSDGKLYGLGSDGTLYNVTIDLTGASTATVANGQVVANLAMGEGGIALDFNPASKLAGQDMGNALRLVDGAANYRLNPITATILGVPVVDSALTFKAGDANAGEIPNVVAAAYTNAFAGTTATTLFDIETGNDVLVRQGDPDPNLGVLTTVGSLGITIGDVAGFDIVSNNAVTVVTNEAFLVTEGNFYKVDLGTGAATLVGTINGATALRGVSVTVSVP